MEPELQKRRRWGWGFETTFTPSIIKRKITDDIFGC